MPDESAERLRTVLLACLEAAGGSEQDVEFVVFRNEDELRRQLVGVEEEDRPLWYPEDQIPQRAIDSSVALAAGLRFRPALATASETLSWAQEAGEREVLNGFATSEAEILRRAATSPM